MAPGQRLRTHQRGLVQPPKTPRGCGIGSRCFLRRRKIGGRKMQNHHRQKYLFVALVVSLAWCGAIHTQAAAKQPNIVMVFIDDLGWGDFSCFGNEQAETPTIDRLAAEGVRFTQFYVNSPICSPSRVAITTGHYPQRWKVGSYLAHRNENKRRGIAQWLDPAAPTLPRLLKQSGYRTGHFGKWHMGGQRDVADAPPITAYGFDASLTNFEGTGPKLLPLTETPAGKQGRIWQDAERLPGPATWMQRSRITGGFTEAALGFMREAVAAEKAFYVNLWPDDVHSPYWPPIDQWRNDRVGKFQAVLEALDRQLTPLFEFLRSTPAVRDNTLVLICSDNGPEPGVGSAGPFRGAKTTLYEGGIRSPLIAWGPGLLSPAAVGSRDESSVFAAFDLVPSLLAIAGVAVPAGIALDGVDVSPALLGIRPVSHPGSLCWRRPPDRKVWRPLGKTVLPDLAIRRGDWKLLCDYDGGNRQLFDLRNDPGETENLAAADPGRAAALATELVAWHESLPADNGPALGRQSLQAAGPRPRGVQ